MSSECKVDVAVLGSGFAGSLAAWLLAKQGRSVALIEHGKHPRFAIGESSTPLADFKLRQIAERHGLPELHAFSQYGSWKQAHPHITCGIKRGFAYFYHLPDQAFQTTQEHHHELLVTANASTDKSDTHWLRADMDHHFVERAIESGVRYFDETSIDSVTSGATHCLCGRRKNRSLQINTRFFIVATGSPKLTQGSLSIPTSSRMPRTNTRALFGHFANLKRWQDVLHDESITTEDHPFPCDDSALHHVFEGGWMWQLRFDDGSTSVGFSLDCHRYPATSSESPTEQFGRWLNRFPSVKRQFIDAEVIRPATGLQSVDRLQHPLRQVTGDRWALLPAAVGFADPLFSTGIAHSLFSVEALVDAIEDLDHPSRLAERLHQYADRMNREIELMDRLVALAYRATGDFAKFVVSTMSYFAAATVCERSLSEASSRAPTAPFLLAENAEFLEAVRRIEQEFDTTNADQFENIARQALEPFNHVGLFAPETPRMYRYTAAPK